MTEKYIHGTSKDEQARLRLLNKITNRSFIAYLGDCHDLSICDFGCGLGTLIGDLAEAYPGSKIVGLEISEAQASVARQNNPGHGNVAIIRTDVLCNDLPAGSFDITYCRYLLEHVADPVAVVKEMVRTTKPGGKIVSQENDLHNVIYHPEIKGHDEVMQQFCNLQIKLGGSPFIGRELFDIYKSAGVTEIELSYAPEIYTENDPEKYRAWMQNSLHILLGVREMMLQHNMVPEKIFDGVCHAIGERIASPKGVSLFHWNRVTGYKRASC
ncbi:MAG: methyltransferase domain-containing protein [Desulfarculus sp.]|jgi:SAM-dependent methyltransferase|nr:MAG: methyltransferase domain-containing protein [Desulfarculus sp.]